MTSLQSLPKTVLQHLFHFVPGLPCMQQLSQVCSWVRAACMSPYVISFWTDRFIAEMRFWRHRSVLQIVRPIILLPYSRMSPTHGLVRGAGEWCNNVFGGGVMQMSLPLPVLICPGCLSRFTVTFSSASSIGMLLQHHYLPHIRTSWSNGAECRVFQQSHWPMVPKEASLDHVLSQYGLPCSMVVADCRVKHLLKTILGAICTHFNIGDVDLPNHKPMWQCLRKFDFQNGDIGALTLEVMSRMCEVPENAEYARSWRYRNNLMPGFPGKEQIILKLLLPPAQYDPLYHDHDTVKNMIGAFMAAQRSFLARQRRLPALFRALKKCDLVPPAESWVDDALLMLPDDVVVAVKKVLTGECKSWTKAMTA